MDETLGASKHHFSFRLFMSTGMYLPKAYYFVGLHYAIDQPIRYYSVVYETYI